MSVSGQGDSTRGQGRGFGQSPREAEAESQGLLKMANTYSYSKDRVIDPSLLVGKIGLEIGLLYQGNSCINTSIYFLVKIVKIVSPNQSHHKV